MVRGADFICLGSIDFRNILISSYPTTFHFEPVVEVMAIQISIVLVGYGLQEVTDLLHQLIYIYSNHQSIMIIKCGAW